MPPRVFVCDTKAAAYARTWVKGEVGKRHCSVNKLRRLQGVEGARLGPCDVLCGRCGRRGT